MARKSNLLRRAFETHPFCAYCGDALSYDVYGGNYATLDHVVPRSGGGRDTRENMTLACLRCNRLKANSTNWQAPSFTFASLFPRAQSDDEHDDLDYAESPE